MKVGALFAGYGGIELALHDVFGDAVAPAWFCEFEKAPSAILAHHWPDIPNFGDVTAVDWASVEPVDIITGGSPCQDLSHAGKRAGMKAGTRSGLWASMCDAIDIIRPRLVVWENVRGALSAEADSAMEQCPRCVGDPRDGGPVLRALGRVLGDLSDLGYDSWWYGLRAADVGAAHGRFRLFVCAVPADSDNQGLQGLADSARAAQAGRRGHAESGAGGSDLTLLPTPAVNDMGAAYTPETRDAWTARTQAAHGNGNGHGKSLSIEAQRLLPTPTTTEATGAGSHGTGGDNLRTVTSLLPTPRATDGTKGGPNQRGSSGDLMLPSAVAHLFPTPSVADGLGGHLTRSGARSDELLLPGVAKDLAAHQLLPTPTTEPNTGNGHARHLGREVQDWREYEAAIRRQEAAFGRPAPLPTEPGKNGQPRLSPAFVEWLMALPAGWVTDVPGISRNDQLKALGNGVCPPQAAAALRAFLNDTSKENAA